MSFNKVDNEIRKLSKKIFFDPSTVPAEIWIDLILENHFSFRDLFRFGLVCRYFSQIMHNEKIQHLKLTTKQTGTYSGHSKYVKSVKWSPDGVLLASCSSDYTIRLWDTRIGKEILVIRHSNYIWSLYFHPNGKWLVSSAHNSPICIWDISNGKQILEFGGKDKIYMCMSPNGKLFVTSTRASLSLWGEDGQLLKVLTGDNYELANYLTFDQSSRFLVISNYNQQMIVKEIETGDVKALESFKGIPLSTTFSADNSLLVLFVREYPIHKFFIYHFETCKLLQKFDVEDDSIFNGCLSLDSQFLFFSHLCDTIVYDLKNEGIKATLQGHTDSVNQLSLSPDGTFLASCSDDTTVRVWDLKEYL